MKYILTAFAAATIMSCHTNDKKTLPDFSFTTLDGDKITQEALKGDVTILCVWATWCGDCIREIPELNELAAKYARNTSVHFIALSDEDEETVTKSLQRFPFNFTHIANAKKYSDQLKTGLIKHFPQVLVVDANLQVIYDVTENKEKIFDVLDGHIKNALK